MWPALLNSYQRLHCILAFFLLFFGAVGVPFMTEFVQSKYKLVSRFEIQQKDIITTLEQVVHDAKYIFEMNKQHFQGFSYVPI